jgi:hypothetical protein
VPYKFAELANGDVYTEHWINPKPGQEVGLCPWGRDDLLVTVPHPRYVRYTWPRGKSRYDACRLAWRYYERHAREYANS